MSTLTRTRSAARPGRRSGLPSAKRGSNTRTLAFDPPQFIQPAAQVRRDTNGRSLRDRARRRRAENTDTCHLRRLLRPGGERRGQGTPGREQEASAVHARTVGRAAGQVKLVSRSSVAVVGQSGRQDAARTPRKEWWAGTGSSAAFYLSDPAPRVTFDHARLGSVRRRRAILRQA